MDVEQTLKELTLLEKARLLSGDKANKTHAIAEKGIRAMELSDGPNGVRKLDETGDSLSGISESLPSTCFPSASTWACSFDRDLIHEMGKALGKECGYHNVDILLGPAVNIKRNPLCGRNFEYLSEDPLLAGELAASYVLGVQEEGVGCSVKHFACNNNEKYRFVGDSILDERALFEIYLRPFERIIRKAHPLSVMSAYNKINGVHCSENRWLLEDVLRKNWGFDGLAMTDWGGIVDREKAVLAGQDLEMPGMNKENVNKIVDGVLSGHIPEEKVDASLRRLFRTIEKTGHKKKYGEEVLKADYDLAVRVAEESAVLLKNEDVLPLSEKEEYCVVGDFFDKMRYQGSGSSLLNPYRLVSPKAAFENHNIRFRFARGYNESELNPDPALEEEALHLSEGYDTILFFGGQNDYVESEGFDRETMQIPENQSRLLKKLVEKGKKIVFLLFGGSSIEMEDIQSIAGLLLFSLPGEGGGEAAYRLLFGKVSPSGRLAETWRRKLSDTPFQKDFVSCPQELYKESIFVGYRYSETAKKDVLFPFGYGLSYSRFRYRNLAIETTDDCLEIGVDVKNIGPMAAKEVVQVYLSLRGSRLVRPQKELKGFEKVSLEPQEEKTVRIIIPKEDIQVYDRIEKRFVLEKGNYLVQIGKNVHENLLEGTVEIDGEAPSQDILFEESYGDIQKLTSLKKEDFEKVLGRRIPDYVRGKRPYTMETPIEEFESLFGKIFCKATANVGKGQYRKALKMEDGPEKEREKKAGLFVYRMMPYNCLRSMAYSSSGKFDPKIARAILDFVNGHFIKGIKKLLRKETYHEGNRKS